MWNDPHAKCFVVIDGSSFSIGSTMDYDEYRGGGICLEQKMTTEVIHVRLIDIYRKRPTFLDKKLKLFALCPK